VHTGFWFEKLKESDNSENLDIDVDDIEMDLRGIGGNMDWIYPTLNKDQWRALVIR
jgi:hypothetical protein